MPDEFTSVTTTSYGDRISGSSGRILFGFIMFIVAFPLLWWNEGRSLHRFKTLEQGRKTVVMASADQIDPSHNNKLIYVNGNITTDEVLNDKWFGVNLNALKLNRIAEIYQWQESEDTETTKHSGGSQTKTTTYSYKKAWVPDLIDSSQFKHPQGHENKGAMPYKSQLFTAQNIKLGAFTLADKFVSKITWSDNYPLTEQNVVAMNDQLKGFFKLNNGAYFYGENPADPQIGAIRIHYTVVQPTEVSIVGQQENNQIGPYYINNDDIQLLEKGNVTVDSMFADAESYNSIMTWLVRVGGIFLMWFGLRMIVGPIAVLADYVPIVGSIVNAGLETAAGIIATICSVTTIGLAWITYRPLIGISLLAVALVFILGGVGRIILKMKEYKTKIPQPQQSSVVRTANR